MLWHMRTTFRLRDDLLKKAKRRAAEEGRTLTSLVEEGLGLALARREGPVRSARPLPISKARGGVRSGIDLNHSADLEARMDER